MMKLSFCTTCMNRSHHLKRTLAPNLENMIPFGSVVEWVIVNYNSQDDLDEFLKAYVSLTASGRLTYYRTTAFPYFHHSHAKNLSHILSGGDYVMNLDADNFMDIDGISKILRRFYQAPDALIQGLGGLIGLRKSHFLSIGGYDEDFHGWGHEDNDLVMRGKQSGLTYFQSDWLSRRIEHSDEERVKNLDPAFLKEFEAEDPTGIKFEMNDRNGLMCMAKCAEGKVIANENRMIGRASVTKNFSEETFEVGWMVGSSK